MEGYLLNYAERKVLAEKILDKCVDTIIETDVYGADEFGLLGGLSGSILFMSQVYCLRQKAEYIEWINSATDVVIRNINSSKLETLCDGMAGICWLLRDLSKTGIIETDDINESLRDVDEYILKQFYKYLEADNLDYLHGAIGIAHYLISNRLFTDDVCRRMVDKLYDNCIRNNDGSACWLIGTYVRPYVRKEVFNLGLSHGMASYMSVLAEIAEISDDKKALDSLESLVRYYSIVYNKRKGHSSSFPTWITDSKIMTSPDSRLAWCYGDVGIGFALHKASIVLKDSSTHSMAEDIMKKAAEKKGDCPDICFCHGTAGLHYMFNRYMTFSTEKDIFEEASDYWLNYLLRQVTSDTRLISKDGHAFLRGTSGIGVSLLSSVTNIGDMWDKYLLLI